MVVRASAGTGKTYQLVVQYLRRLRREPHAARLLATTFTRKAAGEILERVLLRLAEAALDPEKCARLAGEIGDPTFESVEGLTLLKQLGQQLHLVQISTLDSLYSRLATSATLDLGLPPGWQILDEQADAQLRQEAITRLLQAEPTSSVVRLSRMLAKGNTNRSVHRLLHNTINTFYNLYLATTKDAWEWFPPADPPLTDETLQSITSELRNLDVSDKRFRKAIEGDCQRLLLRDLEGFCGGGLTAKVLSGELTYYKKPIDEPILERYERLIRHMRSLLMLELTQQTQATYELLDRFHAVYSRLKHEARGVRFEDITLRLAAACADGTRQNWQSPHQQDVSHLLLDEFQDTSWAQWQVLRPLAQLVTGDGENSSFFCVGDIKQAIYNWRGGMAELFDAIEEQLPGLRRQPLSESRRSAPVIIDTVNALFEGMSSHPNLGDDMTSVQEWCRRFDVHTTAKTELSGYVSLVAVAEDEKPGEEKHTVPATIRHAAREVADIVGRCPGRTVGVLFRRNVGVRQMIAQRRSLGIDASEEGGNPAD